jgi:hypothetical protein
MFGGAVHTDPARFPQSHEGALITLIFYGIAVTIVVLNCIKLYVASNATLGDGSGIVVSIATQHVKFNGKKKRHCAHDILDVYMQTQGTFECFRSS